MDMTLFWPPKAGEKPKEPVLVDIKDQAQADKLREYMNAISDSSFLIAKVGMTEITKEAMRLLHDAKIGLADRRWEADVTALERKLKALV